MKASEARAAALKIVAQKRVDGIERAAKARVTQIKNEKARRLKFYNEFMEECRFTIQCRVEDGETEAEVAKWPAESDVTRAEAHLKHHGYIDLIKRVEAQLRKEGYKVDHYVKTFKERTYHESNVPDYDFYEYQAKVRIAW